LSRMMIEMYMGGKNKRISFISQKKEIK
jgi:hypothetical protein